MVHVWRWGSSASHYFEKSVTHPRYTGEYDVFLKANNPKEKFRPGPSFPQKCLIILRVRQILSKIDKDGQLIFQILDEVMGILIGNLRKKIIETLASQSHISLITY